MKKKTNTQTTDTAQATTPPAANPTAPKTKKNKTSKATEPIFTLKYSSNNKTFALIKGDVAKELVILSEKLKMNPKELITNIIHEEYEKRHGKQKA